MIARLDKSIKELDAAVKAGDKDLSDKITELTNVLNSEKEALESTDTANKEYLEREIVNANIAVRLLIARGSLMLLAGCVFVFLQQWIYAYIALGNAFSKNCGGGY